MTAKSFNCLTADEIVCEAMKKVNQAAKSSLNSQNVVKPVMHISSTVLTINRTVRRVKEIVRWTALSIDYYRNNFDRRSHLSLTDRSVNKA